MKNDSEPARIRQSWEQRVFYWRDMEPELAALSDRKSSSWESLRQTLHHYPTLARDLASAREADPRSVLTRELEQAFERLHRAVFQGAGLSKDGLLHFMATELPSIVFYLRWPILSVALGFILSALVGWWLVATYPDLVTLFASEEMIKTVEGGELWTDGLLNILPSSLLSAQIFTNNIVVAMTAVCLGVFYGLGTIYIIALNGLMLGGLFAFTASYNLGEQLLRFVFAHGVVELSIIVLAGAIGFSIGESLASPGRHSRAEAFRAASQRGVKLLLPCLVFLIGAGLIEGYVSPDPGFQMSARIAIGVAYGVTFVLVLAGWPAKLFVGPSSLRSNSL